MSAIACFTFDNMGEAADIGAGAATTVDARRPHPSLTVGYPRLYALLEKHQLRATFFIEGWNGIHHPEAVAEIVARGHELGMHGWLHEPWGTLDPAVEAERASAATQALESAAGVRPIGFRAPGGGHTPHTEAVLHRLGYRYDASLGDGMRPRLLASGLAQVPFVWPCVDGFYYLRPDPVSPAEVRDTWLRALAQTVERGGVFVTICHAFVTGIDPARVAALDVVMAAALSDPRVRVQTVGEVAQDLLAAPDRSM